MSSESIQIFQSIMSSNNEERRNAEAKLSDLKSSNFNDVISVFVSGMQCSDSKVFCNLNVRYLNLQPFYLRRQ